MIGPVGVTNDALAGDWAHVGRFWFVRYWIFDWRAVPYVLRAMDGPKECNWVLLSLTKEFPATITT
jgi:hypothetical protein